jgi:hypothetical protein
MLVMPLFEAFSAIVSGELMRSLTAFTGMLHITNLQFGILSGTIGLVAVGALLVYKAKMDDAKKAAEDHKKAMEDATKATDEYSDALRTLQRLKEEQAGIPTSEAELRDKIKRDTLDLAAARGKVGRGSAAEQICATGLQCDIRERQGGSADFAG